MTVLNPYIILILVSSAGSLLTNPRFRALTTLFCLCVAAVIVPYVQLSDNVFYNEFFDTIRFLDLSDTRVEPGYIYLNKLFSQLVSYEVFRALIVISIVATKVFLLSRFSHNTILVLAFYFAVQFYVDSYLLRASLAGTFVLLALYARFIGRPIIGILLLLSAISMHISAAVVVPLFVLLNVEMSRKTHFVVLTTLFGLSFFPLAELVLGTLGQIIPSLAAANYALSYIGSTHGEAAGILRGSILMYTMIYIVFLSTVDSEGPKFSKKSNLILNCMLFAMVFLLAFSDMVVISDRLSRYTLFFFAVALGVILENLRARSVPLAYFIIICICAGIGIALDEGPYRPA